MESSLNERLSKLETEVAIIKEHYVSHAALAEFRAEMLERFAKVECELATLRVEMRAGFAAIGAKFDAVYEKFDAVYEKFDAVEGTFDAKLKVLEHQITVMGQQLEVEMAKLRGEVAQQGMMLLRWMAVTQLATIGAVAGLIKYLH